MMAAVQGGSLLLFVITIVTAGIRGEYDGVWLLAGIFAATFLWSIGYFHYLTECVAAAFGADEREGER